MSNTHTVITEGIEELKREFDLQKASVGKKRSLTSALKSFALRIAESTGKELIGEDENDDWEDNSQSYEDACNNESRNELREEQRSTLSAMMKKKI